MLLVDMAFQEEISCQSRLWKAHRRDTSFQAGGDLICPHLGRDGLGSEGDKGV